MYICMITLLWLVRYCNILCYVISVCVLLRFGFICFCFDLPELLKLNVLTRLE